MYIDGLYQLIVTRQLHYELIVQQRLVALNRYRAAAQKATGSYKLSPDVSLHTECGLFLDSYFGLVNGLMPN